MQEQVKHLMMASFKIISTLRSISLNDRTRVFSYTKLYTPKYLSSKTDQNCETEDTEKKKKKVPVPKVTLILTDENIQVVNLEEAQKISRRRDLKLVKILDMDTKTQRPIYKLMTGAQYHAEDLKQREAKKAKKSDSLKGEKLLLLNHSISEHDLESRIKNIIRWINKRYEVRVVISGDSGNMSVCDHVYNTIEGKLKTEGRILQKRNKGNELKFQIVPLKTSTEKADGGDNKNL